MTDPLRPAAPPPGAGYREAAALCGGILAGGLLLQVARAPKPPTLDTLPGALLVFVPLAGLFALGFAYPRNALLRFLSSVPFALTALAFVAAAALSGTLVLQNPTAQEAIGLGGALPALRRLGLTDVFHTAWFAALFSLPLLCLGLAVGRRARSFSLRTTVFLSTHGGVALILAGGLFGGLASRTGQIALEEGVPVFQIERDGGGTMALPGELRLERFQVEPFPMEATLVAIDGEHLKPKPSGQALPSLETGKICSLGGWRITCELALPSAEPDPGGAAWKAQAAPRPNPTGAAKVLATRDGLTRHGWISAGPEGMEVLPLEEGLALALLPPQPRGFRSELRLGGRPAVLRVNGPLEFHGWTLTQAGFDMTSSGRIVSLVKAVRDPSTTVVRTGFLLLLLGALGSLWVLPERREGS